MEITTANYLQDLVNQKENLVSTLQGCGVEANSKDTFDTLIPKVEEVYEAGRESIVNESKNTIATVSADEGPYWTFEYPLAITDVSDISHKVKVHLYAHGEIGDYKPTLTITRNGVTETYKLDDAYNSTYEFDSSSPNMSFAIDNSVVEISVTYLKSWGIQHGIETEHKRFWDEFFSSTIGIGYGRSAFAGGGWNVKTFTPIYPEGIIQMSNAERMFEYFNRNKSYSTALIDLTALCEHLNFSKITTAAYMFNNARVKNVTVDLSNATSLAYSFNCGNGGEMENVRIKVSEACTNYSAAFAYMYTIKDFIFLEGSVIAASIAFGNSSVLSDESINSIIVALKDLTGTTSKTLTVHKKVYDRIVADGRDALITAKNWALAEASS